MNQNLPQSAPEPTIASDIAQAFEDLRREVSLTRLAVEGLTAARERIPDYDPTLGSMSEALKASLAHLDRIERSPAVRLSPDAMVAEIVKASAVARAEDVRLLREAGNTLSHAIGRVDGIVERGQSVEGHKRRLIQTGVGGLVLGMLVWAVLPGAVVRSLPRSWAMPERMAARMLRLDMWDAGQAMMAKADPERRRQIVAREPERKEREKK